MDEAVDDDQLTRYLVGRVARYELMLVIARMVRVRRDPDRPPAQPAAFAEEEGSAVEIRSTVSEVVKVQERADCRAVRTLNLVVRIARPVLLQPDELPSRSEAEERELCLAPSSSRRLTLAKLSLHLKFNLSRLYVYDSP